ncbi:phosphatidylserine decarboxylase [Candidatus Legionella polyplacis]|uniref:Phosphatidylserine decarboxylase proenzyme n=1 Tax=Candidatus Legionella polyplacis TaxID=2005262 RepID=A0ABZ2GVC5_9GAMM|nr:archaetidylserine decarboxylase [Candidatus Legionella polyplacis]ATW01938.1 phosphatidylserine decarboxylase [Candidatus Legionella polyplacis]
MLKNTLKVIFQIFCSKKNITLLIKIFANNKIFFIKNFLIQKFIKKYNINTNEIKETNIKKYKCFNDFFIRHLKKNCRIIEKSTIISPVDGIINEIGELKNKKFLKIKNQSYLINELFLHEKKINNNLNKCNFIIFYLSPKNYHRVHMPINGILKNITLIPGKLFSVNPKLINIIPFIYSKNKRLIMTFKTQLGDIYIIFIGAALVGTIGTNWTGEQNCSYKKEFLFFSNKNEINNNFSKSKFKIKKGKEIGYFKLGSTIILIFPKNKNIIWNPKIYIGKNIFYGQSIANLINNNTNN